MAGHTRKGHRGGRLQAGTILSDAYTGVSITEALVGLVSSSQWKQELKRRWDGKGWSNQAPLWQTRHPKLVSLGAAPHTQEPGCHQAFGFAAPQRVWHIPVSCSGPGIMCQLSTWCKSQSMAHGRVEEAEPLPAAQGWAVLGSSLSAGVAQEQVWDILASHSCHPHPWGLGCSSRLEQEGTGARGGASGAEPAALGPDPPAMLIRDRLKIQHSCEGPLPCGKCLRDVAGDRGQQGWRAGSIPRTPQHSFAVGCRRLTPHTAGIQGSWQEPQLCLQAWAQGCWRLLPACLLGTLYLHGGAGWHSELCSLP